MSDYEYYVLELFWKTSSSSSSSSKASEHLSFEALAQGLVELTRSPALFFLFSKREVFYGCFLVFFFVFKCFFVLGFLGSFLLEA